MRKITIEMSLEDLKPFLNESFLANIEYVEGKIFFKVDLERGIKQGIIEIHMKEGQALQDLPLPSHAVKLQVLEQDGNRFTCLFQVKYTEQMLAQIKHFDFENIIYDLPAGLYGDKVIISFLGEKEDISRLLTLLQDTFQSTKVSSVQQHSFLQMKPFLSILTQKQREILEIAQKLGYYEIPRQISTDELAQKLHISKATLLEHVRKAEKRIVKALFE